MSDYGFPWPPMLDCAKFPEDNDMCITAQAVAQAGQQPQSKKEGKGQGMFFYYTSIFLTLNDL